MARDETEPGRRPDDPEPDDRGSVERGPDERPARRFGPKPLDPDRAWDYLLRLLAQRAYTVAELDTKLRRRGIDAEDAAALVKRLHELHLVDDAAYTERYVASRRETRGRIALRRELQRKGVDEALVERELKDLDGDDQVRAAEALLRRNAWRYAPKAGVGSTTEATEHAHGNDTKRSDDGSTRQHETPPADDFQIEHQRRLALAKARSKALAFLARRGFPAEAAMRAIERVGWFDEEA
jgi:SOS response regulatory protein OraA/RecX